MEKRGGEPRSFSKNFRSDFFLGSPIRLAKGARISLERLINIKQAETSLFQPRRRSVLTMVITNMKRRRKGLVIGESSFILVTVFVTREIRRLLDEARAKSAPLFIILLAILRVMWFGWGGKGEENVWKKKGGGNEDEGKEGGGRREIVELARKIRPRISAKRIRSDRYRAKQSSLLTLAKYWMATTNIRLNYTLPLT